MQLCAKAVDLTYEWHSLDWHSCFIRHIKSACATLLLRRAVAATPALVVSTLAALLLAAGARTITYNREWQRDAAMGLSHDHNIQEWERELARSLPAVPGAAERAPPLRSWPSAARRRQAWVAPGAGACVAGGPTHSRGRGRGRGGRVFARRRIVVVRHDRLEHLDYALVAHQLLDKDLEVVAVAVRAEMGRQHEMLASWHQRLCRRVTSHHVLVVGRHHHVQHRAPERVVRSDLVQVEPARVEPQRRFGAHLLLAGHASPVHVRLVVLCNPVASTRPKPSQPHHIPATATATKHVLGRLLRFFGAFRLRDQVERRHLGRAVQPATHNK